MLNNSKNSNKICETYRIKNETLHDSKPVVLDPTRFDLNVTKKTEKLKLTQKYKILSVHDPNTGIIYNIDQIVELNLIDKSTSQLVVPSTCQFMQLDEAIQMGIVQARLIDEYFETSDESFHYVERNKCNSYLNDSIVNTKSPIVKFNMVFKLNHTYKKRSFKNF